MWSLLLAASLSWASDKAIYPAQKINAHGLERIEITGVRGRLKLTGRISRHFRLKVGHSKRRSEDWNLLVERRGKTLVLEVSNAALGREWRKQVKQELWPEFDIELDGPALPTVVSWRDGALDYTKWTADVETSFLSGPIHINGGRGKYKLQAVNSDLSVADFKGDLSLQGESGTVKMQAVGGHLRVNWLAGRLEASQVSGEVQIEARDLAARLASGRGQWNVKLNSGNVDLVGFKGTFKGEGQDAQWKVSGGKTSEFELLSASGPVDVTWNPPARVFLTSGSGKIKSPWTVEDRDGTRVAEGKKGRPPLSQVFVKTGSGDIRFQY